MINQERQEIIKQISKLEKEFSSLISAAVTALDLQLWSYSDELQKKARSVDRHINCIESLLY